VKTDGELMGLKASCPVKGKSKSNLTNFQEISRIHFFKILADFYVASHTITREISDPVYPRTSYVQCTKNRLTCKNYVATYKIFEEHQLNSMRFPAFPRAISNSRRFPAFPEVVNILKRQRERKF